MERLAAYAQGLRVARISDAIVIVQKLSYVYGEGNGKREVGIVPGTYAAVLENDQGIFYQGSGRQIWDGARAGPASLFMGGIWVPKNDTTSVRLFRLRDPQTVQTTNIDEYIAKRVSQTVPEVLSYGWQVVGAGIAATESGTIYVYELSSDSSFIASLSEAVRSRERRPRESHANFTASAND